MGMQLANNLVISPIVEVSKRPAIAPNQGVREWLGIILTALGGVALLVAMVSYNLHHVPSSEVDRIYKNAGSAVHRSFQIKS
jgi:hypothetical protein